MHVDIIQAAKRIESAMHSVKVTGVVMQTGDFMTLAQETRGGRHVLQASDVRGVATMYGMTVTQARHIPPGEFRLEVRCG